MSHRHHLLEKVQVELAALAALALTYFLAAPALNLGDPILPIVFLPTGNLGAASSAAVVVWGLTILCVLVTVSARPEGSMLAALLGSCGYSLYSSPMRALLWQRERDLAGLFRLLAAEVLLLSLVLVGMAILVTLVRRIVASVKPDWAWRSPLLRTGPGTGSWLDKLFGQGYYLQGRQDSEEAAPTARQRMGQAGLFVVCGLLISMVLLVVLMQSSDRGQNLFAMLASFTLGILIAHQVLPVPNSLFCWAMPIPAGILFYLLASFTSVPGPKQAWMDVHHYAQALPIDWITVGSGGAVLGFWISERIHEMRHFEKQQAQPQ